MNLSTVGSVAYDSIETPFGNANKTLGGSASYFCLAASYFTEPGLVAVVGEDFSAEDIKKLSGRKINLTGLSKAKGKTFHWAGKYSFDLNSRESLKTELGVFLNFQPVLSPAHQNCQYLFLGNIQPSLQLNVLKQVKSAGTKTKFVGLDTMNYWIESALADLKKVLQQVDILIINDSEAREFTKEHNIIKAAGNILRLMGKKKTLIIKRGEYGLLMFNGKEVFNLPGYPLEDVSDPTGAGDSFAGGFMGYLTKTNNTSWANLKRACVAGSVMASFCCEQLGTGGLLKLSPNKIAKRLEDFKTLTHFDS